MAPPSIKNMYHLGALGTAKRAKTRLHPVGNPKIAKTAEEGTIGSREADLPGESAAVPTTTSSTAAPTTTTTPDPTTTTATTEISTDAEMGLPGTAKGQGGSGDGNSNSSMQIYAPERPISMFGYKTSTYRKVHRFLTFGIANTWIGINLTLPAENQRWLTTALAAIPWEYPFLYLNPSEFNLLSEGSFVKEVRIEIYHRGNRIAFETSSTAANLATLNQIQNLQVAHGLNKTGWGTDSTYLTFNGPAGEPMQPLTLGVPVNANYTANMYGADNATISTVIPSHQIGAKMPLVNYFNVATSTQQFGGCPPISENIQMFDGKTTINQCVGQFTWIPKMAPLKIPLKHIRSGLPRNNVGDAVLDIHTNGALNNTFDANLTSTAVTGAGASTTITQTTDNPANTALPATFTIETTIEKSQFFKQGPWGQMEKPIIQPSVHVGLQAIPSLTTNNIFSPITSWSDAQADWEVIAEMDVVEHSPTKFPFATAANVPAGDVMYRTQPTDPNQHACTYAGLYPNNVIRV
nr:MAG: structural protein VP1 [Canine parvovirus]